MLTSYFGPALLLWFSAAHLSSESDSNHKLDLSLAEKHFILCDKCFISVVQSFVEHLFVAD